MFVVNCYLQVQYIFFLSFTLATHLFFKQNYFILCFNILLNLDNKFILFSNMLANMNEPLTFS